MIFLLPRTSPETLVSEASTTLAVFHSRVFARDAVATSIVNSRSLNFLIGPPLQIIMPFPSLAADPTGPFARFKRQNRPSGHWNELVRQGDSSGKWNYFRVALQPATIPDAPEIQAIRRFIAGTLPPGSRFAEGDRVEFALFQHFKMSIFHLGRHQIDGDRHSLLAVRVKTAGKRDFLVSTLHVLFGFILDE